MSAAETLDVLVVDDDDPVARLVQAVLEREHHRVAVATEARAALDLLEERPCRLVLTDFTMPDMNGMDLVRAATDGGCRATFLVMSAFLDGEVEQALCAEGAVAGIVGKPFEVTRLVRDVAAVLAQSATVPC